VTDDDRLLDDIAGRAVARSAMCHLDSAWPETATLDISTLGVEADDGVFGQDVQFIVDEGLIQYELVMISGTRTVYRFAAITQHGREVLRELRERLG
jgi:hypothetical protein